MDRLCKTVGIEGLEMVGLVVSNAHDGYEMYIRTQDSQVINQIPLFLLCDRVAKSIEEHSTGNFRVISVQQQR